MRRTVLTICLIMCCLILAGNIYVSSRTADDNRSDISSPGTYYYDRDTSPYIVDFYMCGEWEYYPGMLIYENQQMPNFEGGTGSVDPTVGLDRQFNIDLENVNHIAEDNTRPENDYADYEMHYITVPLKNLKDVFDHDPNEVSSYRMVIENLPPTADFDMILSLQGLVYGDYETYIDGHLTSALMPPYGYPTYYFPVPESGRVEIVIQTYHTGSLLNITPRVSFKGIAMEGFDNYRNMILIILGAILTAFLIMMVLMFSLDRKYLYLPFITGLLFIMNFLLNNLWSTGYQGVITSVIPQSLIPHLAWLMFAGAIAANCLTPEIIHSDPGNKRTVRISILLIIIAALIRLMDIFLVNLSMGIMLSDIIIAAVIIIRIILTYKYIYKITRATFLTQTGLIMMIAGAISAVVHHLYGFWDLFLYLQPFTIIIYTIFVFYNNKQNQIGLLKRTRELLEVEKQSSRIQAAMLSSQIQPHFLYNTLTTIQELCYSDPDEAAEMIVTFSQYLRGNLDFMNYEDLVPFAKELDHIHNFMHIQNARYKNSIDYVEDIEVNDFLLPPLTIQPIVENAVKHGIMKETAKGSIILKVYETEDSIRILVINDGKKFTEADLKKGHSMENIRTRLKQLVNGELNIISDDDSRWTTVEVVIPLNY